MGLGRNIQQQQQQQHINPDRHITKKDRLDSSTDSSTDKQAIMGR